MLMCYIVLSFFLPNLYGLNCYSNGLFYFSRNEFNWNNLTNILNNINHTILFNKSLTCHVRITVDYDNNNKNSYIIIEFNPKENLTKTNIEFGSTINFLSNNIQTIISYLDYQCLSDNLCDRKFLIKWSKQYLDEKNNSLHKHLLSSWKNSFYCQENFYTNSCESYLCFNIYNELKNLSYGKFQCNEQSSTNPVNIYIKINSGKNHHIYQCHKNQCTGEILYNSLIKTNSTELFRIKENQNSIDELIFKRAIIIVGILVIIGFIAFYIQCRKYKQGYKLTRNAY